MAILDPVMCCANDVCGVDIDQARGAIAAGLDCLKSRGVPVARFHHGTARDAQSASPSLRRPPKSRSVPSGCCGPRSR
ncbi:MAG: arsenic metallochaperone ArsD family protein [Burkholderiaceae bacterium]